MSVKILRPIPWREKTGSLRESGQTMPLQMKCQLRLALFLDSLMFGEKGVRNGMITALGQRKNKGKRLCAGG